jgi:SAGA-associated factor 29
MYINILFYGFTLEMEIWSQASESLNKLSEMYKNPAPGETVNRVNRLITAWPQDDRPPAEGYEGVKPVYKKLRSGLNEIQAQAENEVA